MYEIQLSPVAGGYMHISKIEVLRQSLTSSFNARQILGAVSAVLVFTVLGSSGAWADDLTTAEYMKLEATQNAANSNVGPRYVPARVLPVPKTASKELQNMISQPYSNPKWTANHPQSAADWAPVVDLLAEQTVKALPGIREKLGVSSERITIGGVNSYILTPKQLPNANKGRVALHLHGGGYVYSPGEAGSLEGVLMAGYGGYKVVSVDYRMPPAHPYPAALDDAIAVYKELLKKYDHRKIAVFGTSTGGGMTLALVLRAKAEGLPLPAAIAPGTPWSDITEEGGGDSMKTLEWIDGNLVSYRGYISHAAIAYANGHDMKDPYLSPLNGDFKGFPPAIITTGTRDLFLSLSAMTHRKLRQAGVDAQLHVYEGLAHAQYFNPWLPETKEIFAEIGTFFGQHLAK